MFVIDLAQQAIGETVTITGHVQRSREYTGFCNLWLRDLTGGILINVRTVPAPSWPSSCLRRGERIRVTGRLGETKEGRRQITDVTSIDSLGSVRSQLDDLDREMLDQASRMHLSRVCNIISGFLRNEVFSEIDVRVISTDWVENGLEPLRVIYPGFGSPATLATSPSTQVMDFLTATGTPRAFTVSLSFSTTYRFPHFSAESRVIVAKAIDMDSDQLELMLAQLATRVLNKLGVVKDTDCANFTRPSPVTAVWPERIVPQCGIDSFAIVRYPVSIHATADRWNTTIETIFHVQAHDGSLLFEAAQERLGNVLISTITVYPAQFLDYLRATPDRRLRNLGRIHVWVD